MEGSIVMAFTFPSGTSASQFTMQVHNFSLQS